MKRGTIPVLVAFVMVGWLAFSIAQAADLIGNWAGYGNGSTTNSGAYIQYWRNVKSGLNDACPTMVTFRLYDGALVFAASGATNDTTGSLQIDDWLGSGATVVTTLENDSATNDDSVAVYAQMKNCSNCSWYRVKTLMTGDSVAEGTFIDSLDFSDPALRHPFLRFIYDGVGSATGHTNDTKVTADVTLFKPTQ